MIKYLLIATALFLSNPIISSSDSIRDIPFEEVGDTNLTEDFTPKETQPSSIRWDVEFVESAVLKIIELMKWIIWTLVVLWWIFAWFQLITSQWDEDAVKTSKRQLRWSIIALIVIFLAEPLIRNVFFWWGWTIAPWEAIFNTDAMKTGVLEIEWVIKYLQTFIALMALFMVITVWIKTIFSEKEEAIEEQKKTIIWIWIWILLVFLNKVFIYYWIMWNPVTWEESSIIKTIAELSAVIKYFLWFIWAMSFLFIVYWGFLMITAQWDEEQAKSGRSIVINIFIGILIIITSYALISMILTSTS